MSPKLISRRVYTPEEQQVKWKQLEADWVKGREAQQLEPFDFLGLPPHLRYEICSLARLNAVRIVCRHLQHDAEQAATKATWSQVKANCYLPNKLTREVSGAGGRGGRG